MRYLRPGVALTALCVPGTLTSAAQTYQSPVTRVDASYYAAPVTFTAPPGVTSIQAIGDVNVTTCYGSNPEPLCVGGRTTGGKAYVGTQLVVHQLNSNGSVCAPTDPWPGSR